MTSLDLSDVPVVDGHCHPLLPDPWQVTAEAFVDRFTEGRPATMTAHASHTGYFMRAIRAMARRLDCEPTVDAVLERRRARGDEEARRLFEASRIAALLVDTGYPPEAMSLDEMRRRLSTPAHQVFRTETCAQALLARGLPYADFVDAFRSELLEAAERSAALKSIIAYRSGLEVERWSPADAARSYRDVQARVAAGGSPRLTERPLLDTLFHVVLDVCRETDRPLQVHAGFGDPDVDLRRSNPLHLRPILEDERGRGVRIVVLHMAYPYFREASFMAAVWPQVYVDLSLALPFLGPAAAPIVTEMLSLAPATKLTYGSDVGGLPELFALSADWARAALSESLEWLIARDGLTVNEARAVARRVLSDNAVALYGLPPVRASGEARG